MMTCCSETFPLIYVPVRYILDVILEVGVEPDPECRQMLIASGRIISGPLCGLACRSQFLLSTFDAIKVTVPTTHRTGQRFSRR